MSFSFSGATEEKEGTRSDGPRADTTYLSQVSTTPKPGLPSISFTADGKFKFFAEDDDSNESSSGECSGSHNTLTITGSYAFDASTKAVTGVVEGKDIKSWSGYWNCLGQDDGLRVPEIGDALAGTFSDDKLEFRITKVASEAAATAAAAAAT